MNKLQVKFRKSVVKSSGKFLLPLFLVLFLSGFQVKAQLPDVMVRFNNANYDCQTQIYCLDVEFQSSLNQSQLFGINVRLFYDDNILEYLSIGDTAQGYGLVGDTLSTGISGSGTPFGFSGDADWLNAKVQKKGVSNVYLTNNGWTKLFNICFHVDDPNSLNIQYFCPSIVWDLQYDPQNGGYIQGDDGVVITLANGLNDSRATNEHVAQYNWVYNPEGMPFGNPVQTDCISTICWTVPVSNWALFLGIGLMLLTTLVIYRKRIS